MARPNMPTIPDDKLTFYREQLYRELSQMFTWEGLPTTIPRDYLEQNLVRYGNVLFYENETIGLDILRASPVGHNRHDQPTTATTYVSTTTTEVNTAITRTIKRLTDSENVVDSFNTLQDGVLIRNMERGQSCQTIVEHFAERLALVQQAFDTNLMWQNIPYIFLADGNEMKLSYEKMFADIFSGKPAILADKQMFMYNTAEQRSGVPTGIPYIGKELMDTRNEIMMKFRETVGITTAGVDKAERTNTLEINSNVQHTKTVLQIMLEQREIACENINAFFGTNISVNVIEPEEKEEFEEEEGGEDGSSNGGVEELTED